MNRLPPNKYAEETHEFQDEERASGVPSITIVPFYLQHEDDCTGFVALRGNSRPYLVNGARIDFTQLGYDAPVTLEWRGKSKTFNTERAALISLCDKAKRREPFRGHSGEGAALCQHESETTPDGHGAYCRFCGEGLA